MKEPSSSVDVDPAILPSAVAQLDRHAGQAQLARLDLALARRRPGLKSRQTVPVISPAFAGGCTACSAPFGTCVGGIAVSAEQRPSSPGRTGVFSDDARAAVCP